MSACLHWHFWVFYSADFASQYMAHDGASDPEIYLKDLSDANTAQWFIVLWDRPHYLFTHFITKQ